MGESYHEYIEREAEESRRQERRDELARRAPLECLGSPSRIGRDDLFRLHGLLEHAADGSPIALSALKGVLRDMMDENRSATLFVAEQLFAWGASHDDGV